MGVQNESTVLSCGSGQASLPHLPTYLPLEDGAAPGSWEIWLWGSGVGAGERLKKLKANKIATESIQTLQQTRLEYS